MKKFLHPRKHTPLCLTLLIGWLLTGCAPAPQPTPTNTVDASPTAPPSPTDALPTITPSTTHSPQPTQSPTPNLRLTRAADKLTNPPPTATDLPIFEENGNITWHPQEELISWSDVGGDGVYYYSENFTLLWDGTLLQPGGNSLGAPYITKLSQDETCKLLNTAAKSSFFEEPAYYNFPFDGLGSGTITVNSWRLHSSGAQALETAMSGAPYYRHLFCRNCPIPDENTIIKPGLANMRYLLQNYIPQKRTVAPVETIHLTFHGKEDEVKTQWPVTGISFQELWKKCNDPYDCSDAGMIIEGELAREIIQKVNSGQIFSEQIYNARSTMITYEAVWPQAPEVPADYTLTCNTNGPSYPILPLDPQQKFWYYAPSGQWGAERVEGQNRMRVVNTSGYEKSYQYDAKLFGRESIQIFPRFWSADDQFFYVNILPGGYTPSGNSSGLQKIDVKNEKVSYVFIGTEGQEFAYNFSGSGKWIAYLRQEDTPLKLVVANAISGAEKSAFLPAQYTAAGSITWPIRDNDKLFLAATYEQDGVRKSDILMIDPSNPARMQVIYTGNEELKMVDDWNYASICPLSDDEGFCRPSLNLETGEIQN